MTEPSFVHLRVHSHFSPCDGTLLIDEIVQEAVRQRMPAIALTDRNTLAGAVEFHRAALAAGIRPIIGCDFDVAPHTCVRGIRNRAKPFRLTLLATNAIGYRNLVALSTRADLAKGFGGTWPGVEENLLEDHREGILCLTGGETGEVHHLLSAGKMEEARLVLSWLAGLYGRDNLFVELTDPELDSEKSLNPHLCALAESVSVRIVATRPVQYLRDADELSHRLVMTVFTNQSVGPIDSCFHGACEMRRRFRDFPAAADATLEIAGRCEDIFERQSAAPGIGLRMSIPEDEIPAEWARRRCIENLPFKTLSQPIPTGDLLERIDQEIAALDQAELMTETVVLAELACWLCAQGYEIGADRSRFSHSLVFYLLDITGTDPFCLVPAFDLFLSAMGDQNRDLALELSDEGRVAAIAHLRDAYGMEAVVPWIPRRFQIGANTWTKWIGHALGCLSLPESDITDHVAYANVHAPRSSLDPARVLLVDPRSVGRLIPRAFSPSAGVPSAFELTSLGGLGGLVVSLVSSETLSVIQEVQDILKARGVAVSFDDAETDKSTFVRIRRGATGIYRDACREFAPRDLADLSAMVALVGNPDRSREYLERRDGKPLPAPDHPLLAECYANTFGIPVYTEQVFQALRDLTRLPSGDLFLLWRSIRSGIGRDDEAKEIFSAACCSNHDIVTEEATALFASFVTAGSSTMSQSFAVGTAKSICRSASIEETDPVVFREALKRIRKSKGSTAQLKADADIAQKELRKLVRCMASGATSLTL